MVNSGETISSEPPFADCDGHRRSRSSSSATGRETPRSGFIAFRPGSGWWFPRVKPRWMKPSGVANRSALRRPPPGSFQRPGPTPGYCRAPPPEDRHLGSILRFAFMALMKTPPLPRRPYSASSVPFSARQELPFFSVHRAGKIFPSGQATVCAAPPISMPGPIACCTCSVGINNISF